MRIIALISFTVLLGLTSAQVTIVSFDAQTIVPIQGNVSTFGSDYIQMWAEVINCPAAGCSCQIEAIDIDPNPRPLVFSPSSPTRASMNFTGLQPVTSYTFVLTCQGAPNEFRRSVRTDVGPPSVPVNITANLIDGRVKLSWSRPSTPAGPISIYRLYIDGNSRVVDLAADQFFYHIPEAYAYGTRHQYFISACNRDRTNTTICSSSNEGKIEFYLAEPTTTTTKRPNSSVSFFPSMNLFIVVLFAFYSKVFN